MVTVDWEMNGQRFTGINGGPEFKFDEAISFLIECEDQAELDGYWDALLADGGQESMCGWLKDRFGVSWQVVPTGMDELFADDDSERVDRAWKAMMEHAQARHRRAPGGGRRRGLSRRYCCAE